MEHVFATIASGMAARGLRVTCAYHSQGPTSTAVNDDGSTNLDLPVVETWRKIPTPASVLRFATALGKLIRYLRHLRPHTVNVHFAGFHLLYFVLLRPFFGYHLVVTAHGSDINSPGTYWPIVRLCLAGTDLIVCVSPSLYEKLQDWPSLAVRAEVITNGIDRSFWLQVPVETSHPRTYIVAIGALKKVKGHDILIRAYHAARQRGLQARLVIVGRGEEEPNLWQLIESLDLTGLVELAGQKAVAEVRDLLWHASFIVHPSRNEGWSLTLMEAMASARPVVATNVGAAPDMLGSDYPYLVPPEDEAALADCLLSLANDSEAQLYWSRELRRRSDGFDVGAMLDRYALVLRDGSASPPDTKKTSR